MKSSGCSICLLKSEVVKDLDTSELNILGNSCVEAVFKKGETIFKQNALSSNIIYLQTGLVKLMIEGPQRIQILRLKKAPCYLGLPTTMGDKINNYSVVALEPVSACFIDIDVFKHLLRINSDFSYEIIIELCKNELKQFHRCVKLIQNEIYGRLAGNLLYFADEIYQSQEYNLPLNRSEIADMVCTSRETVSRILNSFAQDGIISISGKRIKILKKSLLEKISEKG